MNKQVKSYISISILCILVLFIFLNQQLFNAKLSSVSTSSFKYDSSINIQMIEEGLLIQQKKNNTSYYKKLQTAYQQNQNDVGNIIMLQKFWKDSMQNLLPYYFYLGKESLLNNNAKKMKEAGSFFFDLIRNVSKPEFKKWFSIQAKELFGKALTINPNDDSAKVYYGASLLFGELGETPMQGVSLLREVVQKDSIFELGQKMLGLAALVSGQLDKALQRFLTVKKLNPNDIENLLALGEILEKLHKNKEAKEVYKSVVLKAKNAEFIKQLQQKIKEL